MKKLFLLFPMFVCLGYSALAQTSSVKFGIKAGVTFPKVSYSSNIPFDIKTNTSFYVGGNVDFQTSKRFSVQPGILLIGKGSRLNLTTIAEDNSVAAEQTTNLMYIEIPVNGILNFSVGTGKIFVGAGPYFAYGISGKIKNKLNINSNSGSTSNDVNFGSSEGETSRSDMGLNFLVGYQLVQGFNIHAGYGLGLKDISNSNSENVKNRVISVGLGFTF